MYQCYFDDSRRPIEEKIAGAMAAYEEKYGRKPGIVLTHPEQCIQRADVLVVTGESQGVVVRPNHLWLGLS